MLLVRFLLAWFIFTFGPGIATTGRLTRNLDLLRRVIVALGVGTAAAPLLIDVLGRLHLVPIFPYLAAALTIGGLTLWRRNPYRTCPLKYKFARVFRIPAEPTLNQRFGIFVHQVLERWHGGAGEMGELVDVAWRRGGFGDSDEEHQLRAKAE